MPRIVKGDWMKLDAPIKRKAKKKLGAKSTDAIYQLKIALKNSKPLIWRRLKVRSGISLGELHFILQKLMGWSDRHAHIFELGDASYAPSVDRDGLAAEDGTRDENGIDVKTVASVLKSKLIYEYDMDDSWLHVVTLEKILPADRDQKLPLCTGGSGACPPEDCGGLWGYYAMLDIIEDPNHPEFKRMQKWVGDGFEPEKLDVNAINKQLKEFQKL